MLVWRDKIACHGPRLPAISLLPPSLPRPLSAGWYYRFGALLAAATTPVYAHVSRDMTNSVTPWPASLIREMSSRLFVQLRAARWTSDSGSRGLETVGQTTSWIMFEDLFVFRKERSLWRRLERGILFFVSVVKFN